LRATSISARIFGKGRALMHTCRPAKNGLRAWDNRHVFHVIARPQCAKDVYQTLSLVVCRLAFYCTGGLDLDQRTLPTDCTMPVRRRAMVGLPFWHDRHLNEVADQ
jgi:hypothetical protein